MEILIILRAQQKKLKNNYIKYRHGIVFFFDPGNSH
jgi:hypothetical protein